MPTVPAAPPIPAPEPVDPATVASWPAHRPVAPVTSDHTSAWTRLE